jgi:hypothetical protein
MTKEEGMKGLSPGFFPASDEKGPACWSVVVPGTRDEGGKRRFVLVLVLESGHAEWGGFEFADRCQSWISVPKGQQD